MLTEILCCSYSSFSESRTSIEVLNINFLVNIHSYLTGKDLADIKDNQEDSSLYSSIIHGLLGTFIHIEEFIYFFLDICSRWLDRTVLSSVLGG